MSLVLKQFEILGKKREAYILTPKKDWDSLTKPSSIMILRPLADDGINKLANAVMKKIWFHLFYTVRRTNPLLFSATVLSITQ